MKQFNINETVKLHQPNWYEVDVDKLSKATMKDVAHLLASLRVSETYDYFEAVKPFLKIPEKSKTLEEIQQELDEKFEKLLATTKKEFAVSKQRAEYDFDKKFYRINENFKYIKQWGRLPYITLDSTVPPQMNGAYFVSTGSAQQWTTEFRFGKGNVGYYCIEPDVKFHMSKKPNFIVRFFMNKCLGFKWRDV